MIGVLAFAAQAQDDDVPAEDGAGDDMPPEGDDGDMHAGGDMGEHDEGDMPPDHDVEGADMGEDMGEDGATPEGTHEDGESEVSEEEEAISTAQVEKLHGKFDANGDGKVTAEELAAFSKTTRLEILKKETSQFVDSVDGNKDGKVTLDELMEANFGAIEDSATESTMSSEEDKEYKARQEDEKELEKKKFTIADANKDGLLDKDELAAVFYPETHPEVLELVAQTNLKQKDKDSDGLLSPEEFWGDQASEDDAIQEEHGELHKVEFAGLDSDKDGKLSLKELLAWESGEYHSDAAMIQLMEIADDDKDGSISKAELDKAREPLANSPASSHMQQWAEHYEL